MKAPSTTQAPPGIHTNTIFFQEPAPLSSFPIPTTKSFHLSSHPACSSIPIHRCPLQVPTEEAVDQRVGPADHQALADQGGSALEEDLPIPLPLPGAGAGAVSSGCSELREDFAGRKETPRRDLFRLALNRVFL